MNRKELYKIALISSPLIALFEVIPPYSFGKLSGTQFTVVLPGVMLLNLIIWFFTIQLKTNPALRSVSSGAVYYLLSYSFIVLCMVLLLLVPPFIKMDMLLQPDKFKQFILSPLINLVALNSIVLITLNSIENHARKVLAETQLNALKLEAEQQQLIRQLQPHFLFNALSTLKSYMRVDPDYAEDYLVKLSDFLRHTISIHQKQLIPLKDELRFTMDYMELQKGRFDKAFVFDISVDSGYMLHWVPIFAVQSLVENALKHNSFHEQNPLRVRICTADEYLVVENNRQPRPGSYLKSGYGLDNLKKRYQLLSGDDVLLYEDETVFVVKIKLLEKEC